MAYERHSDPIRLVISGVENLVTRKYVSRGGEKLAAALDHFKVEVRDLICADLGSHVGGFVDCLLCAGSAKIYSVDTSYGTLAWRLRKDPRVVVLERTNAMHVTLPEPVDLVTIDLGWTPQSKVLPNVKRLLAPAGRVLTLVKPHYEVSSDQLVQGVLPESTAEVVVANLFDKISSQGWQIAGTMDSPLRGHGGNREVFAHLLPA